MHLPFHVLVKKFIVMSFFSLMMLIFGNLSHFLSTYIGIFVRYFHHYPFSLNFASFPLVDKLLVLNSLVFNLYGIHMILIFYDLRRNSTIFSLRFYATCSEDNTLMMLLNKRLSFLNKIFDTWVSYLFSTKLLCLTSIILWYLFFASSINCFFLLKSTSR